MLLAYLKVYQTKYYA